VKAVLFDLDDTLYPEHTFVESGFRAVASYLGTRYHQNADTLMQQMLATLHQKGRGSVFDTVLHAIGHYSETRVRLLVYLYRSHRPVLRLYDDVLPTLATLQQQGIATGIITDGLGSVQRNKIAALKLDSLCNVVLCTDELGKEHWKPSPVPFLVALDMLGIAPEHAMYVGDNAAKDFVAPNALSMHTMQIQRLDRSGIALDTHTDAAWNAQSTGVTLHDLLPIVQSSASKQPPPEL
jgi:putative hydrolase of the HAD superfamily